MLDLFFGHVDWDSMFDPKHALFDSVLRGTVIYISLFLILRFLKNRSVGGVGMSDLMVVILIANALQNGLIGKGDSITEGLVSTLTVIAWSAGLDWAMFRFPRLGRILRARPVPLIHDGAVVPAGLRKERMTEDALRAQLRIGGVADPAAVRAASVEENGQISIILR